MAMGRFSGLLAALGFSSEKIIMKVLVSAYACEPATDPNQARGTRWFEPPRIRVNAGCSQEAIMSRSLRAAVEKDPTPHPVHFVGVDAPQAIVRLKRRLSSVRLYYSLWQRIAGRRAHRLDKAIDFDVIHHATWSTFWLPVGVMGISKPLVVGPVAGGELTPRTLLRYLGPKGVTFDTIRWLVSRSAGIWKGLSWRRHVSVLLAQNEQMNNYAKRQLVGANVPVIVHPHASNPTVPGSSDAGLRCPEVLFIGRLLRWKGVLLALEAFARSDLHNARLVFIGEGEAREILHYRIRTMGLQDRVTLVGTLPREEVLRRLCTASALLFPSFHDSAGFVVSEALSMGVPVVCLNHGGPGALVVLWPNVPHRAVEVGPADHVVEELADALRILVSNPAPVLREPVKPAVDLSEIVSKAYDFAVLSGM